MKKRILFIVFAFMSLSIFGQLDTKPNYTKPYFQGSVSVADTLQVDSVVQISNGGIIKSVNGSSSLNLRANGNDNEVVMMADNSGFKIFGSLGSCAFGNNVDATNDLTSEINISNFGSALFLGNKNVGIDKTGLIGLVYNQAFSWNFDPDKPNYPTQISTQKGDYRINVTNSVSLGGFHTIVKTDNTGYVNQLGFNSGEAFETILDYETATQNNAITLPDKSGTVAMSTGDIFTGDIDMTKGTVFKADNDSNFIDLDTETFGLDLGINLIYKGPTYLTTFQAKALLNLYDGGANISYNYEDAGGNNVQTSISARENASSNTAVGLNLFNYNPANRMHSEFGIVDNRDGDRTMAWNLYPTANMFPVVAASQSSIFIEDVFNSAAVGGLGVIVKTNNAAYSNQFIFNSGEAFETVLNYTTATQENVITLPNSSGTIALSSQLLDNRIVVNQSNSVAILGGTIDPSKEYFIDGVIDLGATQITIPSLGIKIRGYDFNISGLISSENNYTMFIDGGDCGDVLISDLHLSTTGTTSQVYDLLDSDGLNAIELNRVNYINCTSLGELDGFRQGLETGTGRFVGSPSLTLSGTWLGGYRITTSIVRSLSAGMTEPLFKDGTAFVMNSRFLTDINCDLPTSAALFDFDDTNFPNPSTLQLKGIILTRNGASVPNDVNLTPNISASNLSCSWTGNNGIPNTFIGAIATVSTEVQTTIVSVNTPVPLQGTITTSDLQHFDSPANGQLRHLGINPTEYTVNFDFVLDGDSNDDYRILLIKDDGAETTVYSQIRVINNLQGGRDVAYFGGTANVILNQNDFIFWEVENLSDGSDCTLELTSSWSVIER